jgi:hypothetical protein
MTTAGTLLLGASPLVTGFWVRLSSDPRRESGVASGARDTPDSANAQNHRAARDAIVNVMDDAVMDDGLPNLRASLRLSSRGRPLIGPEAAPTARHTPIGLPT